jgi:hypothetical protein
MPLLAIMLTEGLTKLRLERFLHANRRSTLQRRLSRLSDWQACLAPRQAPRRPAARDQTLNKAVEQALAQPEVVAPVGVSASDWERVLQARQDETEIERLRRLGPPSNPARLWPDR